MVVNENLLECRRSCDPSQSGIKFSVNDFKLAVTQMVL